MWKNVAFDVHLPAFYGIIKDEIFRVGVGDYRG